MTAVLTVESQSEVVLRLVSDFARGLGCDTVVTLPGRIRTEVPDVGDNLLELLTHIALSATRAEIDVAEPLCRVTYRHGAALSAVTLTFRLTEFTIDMSASTGA